MKTPINVSDIEFGKIYYAKQYINAKRIIDQPIIFKDFHTIPFSGYMHRANAVLAISGKQTWVYMNKETGDFVDSLGKPTLYNRPNWGKHEISKTEDEIKHLTEYLEKLKSIF